jgi:hypothetical protein
MAHLLYADMLEESGALPLAVLHWRLCGQWLATITDELTVGMRHYPPVGAIGPDGKLVTAHGALYRQEAHYRTRRVLLAVQPGAWSSLVCALCFCPRQVDCRLLARLGGPLGYPWAEVHSGWLMRRKLAEPRYLRDRVRGLVHDYLDCLRAGPGLPATGALTKICAVCGGTLLPLNTTTNSQKCSRCRLTWLGSYAG